MKVKYHAREAKKIVDRLEEGILKMLKAGEQCLDTFLQKSIMIQLAISREYSFHTCCSNSGLTLNFPKCA